jgi:RNA polymerase sigma factor (sigma-70 family)
VSTVPADLSGKSDAELIESVRTGKIAAYGVLYERHATAAHNLARQLARSSAEADDLVSEAFAKVLDTLRAGKGPDTAFRAYLLTALRHTAYDKTRKDKRIDLTEDMTDVGGAVGEALTVQFSDTAVAGLERTMAAKAFAKLPERWQAVLWHTEIEQQMPAEVAPSLGLTANGVSALAYRAREGLRQAYLQVHLAETSAERCRAPAERLGAWTRDGLSKREGAQVEAHLDECDRCRALAAELADVNSGLRLIVSPIILGGAVTGYLSAAGATKASAVAAGTLFASAGAASSTGAAVGAAAAGPRQFAGVVAPGAPQVAPPVVPAPSAVTPPATPAPSSSVTPAPPQAPALQPPTVTAQTPPQGVELQGGTPANLPITVRNDGGTCSEPVVVTLKLPPGVTVSCPGSSGTVTCKTGKGLEPGQSAVLTFRLVADQTAEGGMVTGSVTAGSQVKVSVAVKVNVKARRTPSTCWSPAPGTRRSRGSGTRSCASKSSAPGRRLSP